MLTDIQLSIRDMVRSLFPPCARSWKGLAGPGADPGSIGRLDGACAKWRNGQPLSIPRFAMRGFVFSHWKMLLDGAC